MYEAHFGLAQLPFRLAPDPRFYVDAAPHRAAIAALMDELRQDEEFIPLVGEFGTGKTTIARRLLEQVHGTRHLIGELPGIRIEGDDLFDRVGEALGLDDADGDGDGDDDPPVERLLRQLQGLARGGRDALLLVDDAQALEAEALARLHALASVRVDGRAALHVALVGRALPAGIEQLRHIGRPVGIGAPVRVAPLDAAGTRGYILERLGRAGWTGRPAFDPATTAAIHERCGGNPGRINRLCGHLLLTLYMEGRDDLSPEIVGAVDELLRLELEGQPATAKLPPPPTRAVPAGLPAAADAGSGVGTASAASRLPATLRPTPGRAVVALAPAPRPRARPRGRPMLAQGVMAVALLVGGGLWWQAISSLATTAPPPPATAAAIPTAPKPSAAAVRAAPDEVLALAAHAIAQSPPRACVATATPRTIVPATVAAPEARGLDADPAGRSRTHARHGGRGHAAASTTPGAVASACTLESEALGLCSRARAHAPVRAAAPDPVPAPAREVVRPAPPPPCDPTRAALALCPAGGGQ